MAASGAGLLAGVPLPASACIGAATVAIRAVLGALGERPGPPGRPASAVDQDSIEGRWLDRARRAAVTFSDVALGVTSEPLAEQAAMTRLRVAETIDVLEGLAAGSSAARRVLERTDVHALGAEAERLRAEHAWASGAVATLVGHSLAAVEARIDLHQRLRTARAGILARLELGVVHLEGLADRVTRLALGSVLGPAPAELDALFDRLAAVRPGLVAGDEPDGPAPGSREPGAAAPAG